MKTHRDILEENKDDVIKLWKQGTYMKEISERYGVIGSSVSKALEEWGVREKIKRWTPNEDTLIRQLKRRGKTAKEISKAVGRTPGAVNSRLRFLGDVGKVRLVNPPLPPHSMDRDADYYVLYKGDEYITEGTVKDIAHQLGVQTDTVYIYKTPSKLKRRGKNQRALVYMGRAGDFYSYD